MKRPPRRRWEWVPLRMHGLPFPTSSFEGASAGERVIALSDWLGREDSNLRMAESKSAALPLGYAPLDPIMSATPF